MHFNFLPLLHVTFLNMFQQSLQISLQRLCVSASYDAIQVLQIFLGKKKAPQENSKTFLWGKTPGNMKAYRKKLLTRTHLAQQLVQVAPPFARLGASKIKPNSMLQLNAPGRWSKTYIRTYHLQIASRKIDIKLMKEICIITTIYTYIYIYIYRERLVENSK